MSALSPARVSVLPWLRVVCNRFRGRLARGRVAKELAAECLRLGRAGKHRLSLLIVAPSRRLWTETPQPAANADIGLS